MPRWPAVDGFGSMDFRSIQISSSLLRDNSMVPIPSTFRICLHMYRPMHIVAFEGSDFPISYQTQVLSSSCGYIDLRSMRRCRSEELEMLVFLIIQIRRGIIISMQSPTRQ